MGDIGDLMPRLCGTCCEEHWPEDGCKTTPLPVPLLKIKYDFYIAGPMRGKPLNNFPAFFEAEEIIQGSELTCINPARLDEEVDPNAKFGHPTKDDIAFYMSRDLPRLLECNAVLLLPGWEDSRGANIEAYVGWMCGLGVYKYLPEVPDWEEMKLEELLPMFTRKMILKSLEDAK